MCRGCPSLYKQPTTDQRRKTNTHVNFAYLYGRSAIPRKSKPAVMHQATIVIRIAARTGYPFTDDCKIWFELVRDVVFYNLYVLVPIWTSLVERITNHFTKMISRPTIYSSKNVWEILQGCGHNLAKMHGKYYNTYRECMRNIKTILTISNDVREIPNTYLGRLPGVYYLCFAKAHEKY